MAFLGNDKQTNNKETVLSLTLVLPVAPVSFRRLPLGRVLVSQDWSVGSGRRRRQLSDSATAVA
ncbi:MAG: hypothetical protein JWS12_402 [Candidatus Saccharibacteria bacterium]|nr:hypothetical protein [Candidatus Saccharibacteria bacterium]